MLKGVKLGGPRRQDGPISGGYTAKEAAQLLNRAMENCHPPFFLLGIDDIGKPLIPRNPDEPLEYVPYPDLASLFSRVREIKPTGRVSVWIDGRSAPMQVGDREIQGAGTVVYLDSQVYEKVAAGEGMADDVTISAANFERDSCREAALAGYHSKSRHTYRGGSMVELFNDAESHSMAVRTDAESPEQFFQQLAHGLGAMIENGTYDGDWTLQLAKWLPQAFEIALKLKGYKADVVERRLITAGDFAPSLPPVVATDERLKPVLNGAA